MAEIDDVTFKIVADVAALVVPLVGTEYSMPQYVDENGDTQLTVDAQVYATTTRTVPPTTISPSRPMLTDLNARMGAGKAIIAIESGDHDVPTKQYTNRPESCTSDPTPTLGYTQSDYTVLLTGTATPGNVIGLQCGNVSTSYLVVAGDTLATIGANLAGGAPANGFFAISVFDGGFTVNAPGGAQPLIVTIGTTSTWIRPVRYRRRLFDVVIYTPNYYDRQNFGRVVETLYDYGQQLPMPDGTIARIADCLGSVDMNDETPENVFLRRIRWMIDFTAVKTFTKTTIVATLATLNAIPIGETLTEYTAPTASQL